MASRGGQLLFSDPNANRIYSYEPQRAALSVFREHSGYEGNDIADFGQPGSNGLTLDTGAGLHQPARQPSHRAVEADGRLTVLAATYHGKRLNSPNDLVYKSDGSLFFTDPPFGLPTFFDDPRKQLGFSGVFRVKDGKVTLVSDELDGPMDSHSPAEDYRTSTTGRRIARSSCAIRSTRRIDRQERVICRHDGRVTGR